MKRSPCWHSPSSLLAASGRLGGAASGRHHVVKFVKRNPTKCSRRFMSVLGCAPASLHPTYDYSIQDSQADCRAPFLRFQISRSPAAGARKDKLRPVTAPSAMRSLRDPLPMSNMLSGPEQYGKGSWQSAFPDQLSKGTLRRKKLQADPTRDASLWHAPFLRFQTSCSFDSGGSQRRTQAGHNTPCSALPVSLAVRSLRNPLPTSNMLSGPEQYGKGSWQSAFRSCSVEVCTL